MIKSTEVNEGDIILIFGHKAVVLRVQPFNNNVILHTDVTKVVCSKTSKFKRVSSYE